MRESIGTVSLLNFVLFFIFLVFAFLMGTMSYYKAYRINNSMVSAIEKYEGFNALSKAEIDNKIKTLGYNPSNFRCDTERVSESGPTGVLVNSKGEVVDDISNLDYRGYCVYLYNNDIINYDELSDASSPTPDQYDTYEVMTIISFQFPVVQDILKLRVTAKTDRIYNFDASFAALGK